MKTETDTTTADKTDKRITDAGLVVDNTRPRRHFVKRNNMTRANRRSYKCFVMDDDGRKTNATLHLNF